MAKKKARAGTNRMLKVARKASELLFEPTSVQTLPGCGLPCLLQRPRRQFLSLLLSGLAMWIPSTPKAQEYFLGLFWRGLWVRIFVKPQLAMGPQPIAGELDPNILLPEDIEFLIHWLMLGSRAQPAWMLSREGIVKLLDCL